MDLLTLLSEAPLARGSARPDTAGDSATPDLALHSRMCRLLSRFSRDGSSGRTSQGYCPQTTGKISDASSPRLMTSGLVWHGRCWIASISSWRRDGGACSLSDILETGAIPQRYFLSQTACRGILRRAEKRGKEIPEALRRALETVASQEPSVPVEQD